MQYSALVYLAKSIATLAKNMVDKQRVLMHGHQGWNIRHGLCHIYMRYVYGGKYVVMQYAYVWPRSKYLLLRVIFTQTI